jgi:hypothetical protein
MVLPYTTRHTQGKSLQYLKGRLPRGMEPVPWQEKSLSAGEAFLEGRMSYNYTIFSYKSGKNERKSIKMV